MYNYIIVLPRLPNGVECPRNNINNHCDNNNVLIMLLIIALNRQRSMADW